MTDTEKRLSDIVADRADWLLDAIAGATQNRMFLRGDAECDDIACGAVLLNGAKAIRISLERARPASAGELLAIMRTWLDADDATHWGEMERDMDAFLERHMT